MLKKNQSNYNNAKQRIHSLIENEKREYKKEQYSKLLYELYDDLPILLFGVVLPGVFISYWVDILHGISYGIVFLLGYGIGKDIGYKKAKGKI